MDAIQTIVVIYAENRSFDNLYGNFPGANGLPNVATEGATQFDRDGKPFKELPPVWDGLTAKGVTPVITQVQTEHLPNGPFRIDDPSGFNAQLNVTTHDLWHRFYQNQMQIDGGRNDRFVAYADSGALIMGHYDGSSLPLYKIGQQYTLADDFFMGAFGGSFLNRQEPGEAVDQHCRFGWRHSDTGYQLAGLGGGWGSKIRLGRECDARFLRSKHDAAAVSAQCERARGGGDPAMADQSAPTTLPPQHEQTIGDQLSAKGIGWAWYAGAWQAALDGKGGGPTPNFQFHHQPFNYFVNYAPGTPARAEHLKEGGMDGAGFIKDIDAGAFTPVTFYKPQGNLNEHRRLYQRRIR